jgi:hypothetical protein
MSQKSSGSACSWIEAADEYFCTMNYEFRHLLNQDFHPLSRVWVYQSSRLFSLGEALEIEGTLLAFSGQWHSHGTPVKNEAHLFFGQFIVFIADETATGVSGCSTDSSMRVIKSIEEKYHVAMFDRLSLAFIIDGKVQVLPMTQLQYALDHGFVNGDTRYFNNIVLTKDELENNWIIPVRESWLARKFAFHADPGVPRK